MTICLYHKYQNLPANLFYRTAYCHQGLHRLEKSLKIKFALKSTGKSLKSLLKVLDYTPRKLCLWWVYCFHVVRACVCVCVRACIRPSVTFCFLNILKSHCWIFIKPCKHVHICKTNTLDKKVRARGQFY